MEGRRKLRRGKTKTASRLSVSGEEPLSSPVIFFLVVAGRFLRRSGSRVSIPNACRHTVLWHPVSAKTLCPLGQPEKALGHEPQIEPWLTPYNRSACQFQKPLGVVATNEDAARRWNNANPTTGARHQTTGFYGERGWMSRKLSASSGGRKMFLDIPFYRTGVIVTYPAPSLLLV